MAEKPLSATMAGALVDIIDKGGKIVRRQGGYWTAPDAPHLGVIGRPYEWWVNTTTVLALVARDKLEYVEWKDGRNGPFPIAAHVKGELANAKPRIPSDILMAG